MNAQIITDAAWSALSGAFAQLVEAVVAIAKWFIML